MGPKISHSGPGTVGLTGSWGGVGEAVRHSCLWLTEKRLCYMAGLYLFHYPDIEAQAVRICLCLPKSA